MSERLEYPSGDLLDRREESVTRYIGKCKRCARPWSILGAKGTTLNPAYTPERWREIDPLINVHDHPCPGCGGRISWRGVAGTYNPGKECNDRCMSATGPACECKCKGVNHGGGWSS